MKTVYKRLCIMLLFSLALWSCEKDEDQLVVRTGEAPVLSSSANNIVLLQENAEEEAVVFNWSSVALTWSDEGYSRELVNYTLQMAEAGTDFAEPIEVSMGNSLNKSFKVSELNSAIAGADFEPDVETPVEVRVKATVASNVAPTYSNVIEITLTPYATEPPYATIYLVGNATEGAWNETAATPMFRDAEDAFVFTYTGYLKADQFKLLGSLGQWAPAWGMGETTNGVTTLRFRSSMSEEDVPNFSGLISTDGYYTITVNLRKNTLTVTPYDASNKTVYTKIGILGEFNSWDSTPNNDQLMTNTESNPHIWSTIVTLPTKADPNAKSELKIRVNNSWDTNWGAEAGKQEMLYGKGLPGSNDNFKITPGKYRLIFNDLTLNYVFIPQK